MKTSTIKWHLARDNQVTLAKFCERNKTRSSLERNTRNDGEHDYFQMEYTFNNGGFIVAELLQGGKRGYSVADHFKVVEFALGV